MKANVGDMAELHLPSLPSSAEIRQSELAVDELIQQCSRQLLSPEELSTKAYAQTLFSPRESPVVMSQSLANNPAVLPPAAENITAHMQQDEISCSFVGGMLKLLNADREQDLSSSLSLTKNPAGGLSFANATGINNGEMMTRQAMQLPPAVAMPMLPQVAPASLQQAQTGIVQVQVLVGVDEQANLTAAVIGAATGGATRVIQQQNWQRTALATAPEA
jgi:hypothetical protein